MNDEKCEGDTLPKGDEEGLDEGCAVKVICIQPLREPLSTVSVSAAKNLSSNTEVRRRNLLPYF